jgi:hypothetical protein
LDRIDLGHESVEDLKDWTPTYLELEALARRIATSFSSTAAAADYMDAKDEVLQHSTLFIRDSLLFYEYMQAVRGGDVGRMWAVHGMWIWTMRGAGCTNYANELLELKARFEYEMPKELQEVFERTWLVNRWGQKGKFIPIDLYLEHINGFIKVCTHRVYTNISYHSQSPKNYYAAHGSNASIEDIVHFASANVEILRDVTHDTAGWLGMNDPHRKKTEVDNRADIMAICSSLKTSQVHILTPDRLIQGPELKRRKNVKPSKALVERQPGVKDVMKVGRQRLGDEGGYLKWLHRSLAGDTDEGVDEGGEGEEDEDEFDRGTAFDQPEGQIAVEWDNTSEVPHM